MQKIQDNLVVGIVGHVSIENLQSLKETVEKLPFFKIIYFKTSSEKLWIMEGSNDR